MTRQVWSRNQAAVFLQKQGPEKGGLLVVDNCFALSHVRNLVRSDASCWTRRMQTFGPMCPMTQFASLTLSKVENNQELSEELWILLGARSPVCEQFLTG